MREYWKPIATVTAIVVVLALFGMRIKHSFAPQAPAVLNYVQHSSPGFLFDGDLRRAWKNVAALVADARREEKAVHLRLAEVTFLHICKLPDEALLWDVVEARNPGFEPLHRYERVEPGGPAKLIGYYTLDGKPLDYDTKVDLRNKAHTLATVELESPIATGKSTVFFRVLRTTSRITTNATGKWVVNLGRLTAGTSTLEAMGLALPAPAALVKYTTDGARQQTVDGMTVLTWLSSQSDAASRNLQATFTFPK
ncbi:MAG: hypothetical protein WCS70_16205 [Verrucomicrobiota bacterium]